MHCLERVTATGTAFWGMPLSFALVTVEYLVESLRSERQSKFIRYEINFSSNTEYQDSRVFQFEDERERFIKENFSDVLLFDSTLNHKPTVRVYFLDMIIDEPMVSVTFIMDYLQIQFGNDHLFNFYVWPQIYQNNERITERVSGYRDRLCSFINSEVTGIDIYLDAGLVFRFANGTVEVPLSEINDDAESEIIEYHGPNGIWNVWRKDEGLV